MIEDSSTSYRNCKIKKKSVETSGEAVVISSIWSLSNCTEYFRGIGKSVETELWLPFALRGAILENVTCLSRLAREGKLNRLKAIEIVEQLWKCCSIYENLLVSSKSLALVFELANYIGFQRELGLNGGGASS